CARTNWNVDFAMDYW
nr:immunoglobulin heavy chain junction region [Mus musculus]